MMLLLAVCSGVRAEEVLAIEKPDLHFETLSLLLFRAVVHGRVKFLKTEYSEDELPLDPDLAAILLDWMRQTERDAREQFERSGIEVAKSDLLFPSPVTGRHYHASPIQQDYIRPAWCCLVTCPTCGGRAGSLVLDRLSRSEREAVAASRGTVGGSGKVRAYRMAHLPPHLPFVAGRHRRAYWNSTKADAARPDLDHDECVLERPDGVQTRGEQQGGQKGTAERIAMKGKTLQPHQKAPAILATAVIWGYLGLACRINGCGGLQCLEFAVVGVPSGGYPACCIASHLLRSTIGL